jgi:hypothetical protein
VTDPGFLISDFERLALSVFHDICIGDRFIGIGYQASMEDHASTGKEQVERGSRVMLALVRSGLVELYREAGEVERPLTSDEAVELVRSEYRPGSAMLIAFETNRWRDWPAFDVVCRATDEAIELFEAGEWAAVRDRLAEADTTGQ